MYSQETIDQIKHHIKTNAYAANYVEPTWYLITTLLFMFGLLYAIHITKGYSLSLILFLALVMMRLFMIFHDMCHRSFYPTDERAKKEKGFNYQMASTIEHWCLFSASYWNNTHSTHHGALGNLDEYDGTRTVFTSSEYDRLPEYQKVLYQIIRFPPVFFLLAPIYIYWLGRVIQGEWMYITKYSLWLVVLYKLGNWKLLISFLIAQYVGGILGIMMFHLQHQVNDGYWKHFDNTDPLLRSNADLSGSTVLTMPWFLEYFSNGIEYHNIHHIDPGIPSYNMKRTYYELVNRGLLKEDKVDYATEWASLWNTLYNEKTEKYE
jgi:omega-6 fatty acid desaturase (delta-12 desaturase)